MASVYYLVENFWLILLFGSGSSAWCATLCSLLPPASLIPHNKQGQQGAGFWYTWRPLVLHYVLSSAFPDYSSIRCNTFRPYIGLCKYSCVFLLSYSLCSYPHVFFVIQSRYRQASAFPVFRGKCPAMALSCSRANVLSSAFYVSGYAAGVSPAASPELISESIIIKQTDPGTSSVNLASSCALISGYASYSGIFLSLFRLRVYYNYTHKLSFCY